ncbi:MAG: ABC transporter ATP-binding protein, partial [Clostridiales Family XIII bacterium]|nr:ABC transporter ATP-binding protein [Clostridiales Family XIII bacterium]
DIAVRADKLSKAYGKTKAIDDFVIEIPKDGLTGLVGRNGSGKTTLLKLFAGRLEPGSGKVTVLGSAPLDNLPVLEEIVYATPDRAYAKGLTLRAIMHQYGRMYPHFDLPFARKLTDYFELSESHKYAALSKGMAAAFNFTCALACRAAITLLDEPTAGMDVAVRRAVYEILLQDYSEHPRTFIVSSHLFAEIEGVLSDVILLDHGRRVLYREIDELRQSAYCVSERGGNNLQEFIKGRDVIGFRTGELGSRAIIMEKLTAQTRGEAEARRLELSAVSAQDICYYLTTEDKEEALSCLWKK